MEYLHRFLFSQNTLPEDELDELFNQLEQLEPPPALIAQLLSTISQLPQPLWSIQQDTCYGWVVQPNEDPL